MLQENIVETEGRKFRYLQRKGDGPTLLFLQGLSDLDDGNYYETVFQLTSTLAIGEFGIPTEVSVYQNYPNPFNPVTNIRYVLPGNVHVKVLIFDIYGNLVQTLVNNYQTVGYHSLKWNASPHSSGLFFVKIIAGEFINSQKLMLIK